MCTPRNNRDRRRGFALLLVVMIVAVLAVVSVTLMNLIQIDMSVIRQSRSNWEARDIAMSANFEFVDDTGTVAQLPTSAAPIITGLSPPAGSVLNGQTNSSAARAYTAEIRFLRWTNVAESSLSVTRALVYEVRTTGQTKALASDTTSLSDAESRSELSFLTTFPAGSLLPRRHAR